VFEELVRDDALAHADDAVVVDAIAGFTRAEATTAFHRLDAIAELTERRLGAELTAERQYWICDGWDSAAAEVAAACGLSHRAASGQMHRALALRNRLPQLAKVMADGQISAKNVATVTWRTQLIEDPEVMANVDAELASAAASFGPMSTEKLECTIDAVVDRHDPSAVYVFQAAAKGCELGFGKRDDATGTTSIWGRLSATDAELLQRRVTQVIAGVCPRDPRSVGERRTQALGVIGALGTALPCTCGHPDCAGSGPDARAEAVVIHVITDHLPDAEPTVVPPPDPGPESRSAPKPNADPDAQPAAEDDAEVRPGEPRPAGPSAEADSADSAPEATELTPQTTESSPQGTADGRPAPHAGPASQPVPQTERVARLRGSGVAVIAGGAIVPTPLLAHLVGYGARVRRVPSAHELGVEAGYRPSAKLARFVRCRDMTCCFPGCTKPAEYCDVDHTMAHGSGGLTHPGNTKCLCRKHHLLKTFWTGPGGWSDQQLADGTVVWLSPTGHRYTRPPGSRRLFPHWDTTTPLPGDGSQTPPAATATGAGTGTATGSTTHGLSMPLRKSTRAQQAAYRQRAQRKRHQQAIDDDQSPSEGG